MRGTQKNIFRLIPKRLWIHYHCTARRTALTRTKPAGSRTTAERRRAHKERADNKRSLSPGSAAHGHGSGLRTATYKMTLKWLLKHTRARVNTSLRQILCFCQEKHLFRNFVLRWGTSDHTHFPGLRSLTEFKVNTIVRQDWETARLHL